MANSHDDNASGGRTPCSVAKARIMCSSWAPFPAEIRLLILEEVSRQKHPGWASCAAVCKQWHSVLAPKNFHRLKLQVPCLEELEHMVIRHRDLVQRVWLNIELPRYTCRSCQRSEPLLWEPRHNPIIRDAVLKLFSILATWRRTGRLTLELNTFSPSDSEHWFKYHHFGLESEDDVDMEGQREAANIWHDPEHGWVNGQQVEAPPGFAILRLSSLICSRLPISLPEVPVVTELVIRRQFRRRIAPAALRLLWERLPRLESIVYEPWRVWERTWKKMYDLELAYAVQGGLPSHVRTVSIFEDFNDQFASVLRNDTLYSRLTDTTPIASPKLVMAFASKSRKLERLSISYLINAQHFFKSCQPSYTWQYLQLLTLTTPILTQSAPQEEIFTLLLDASLAALNMPLLESMVLWNGQHGEACAVIYHRSEAARQATITWRSTWDLELRRDVVESWREVASDSCQLYVKNERIHGAVSCHGDAIYHLHLPDGVVDPVSLWQIRKEGVVSGMA